MSGIGLMLLGSGGRLDVTINVTSTTLDYLLNTSKVATYQPGNTNVTFIIESGIVLGSTSSSTPALTIDNSWAPTDNITIINNGYIVGKGGNGGYYNNPGFAGGPALTVNRPVSITNNSIIGGGGGGGGSCYYIYNPQNWSFGGAGGAGYSIGNGGVTNFYSNTTPGENGSVTTPGNSLSADGQYLYTGSGGALGANGGNGYAEISLWTNWAGGAGGAGGNCTTIGSNSYITWNTTGTRYGTIG